ncbi:MAG: hypothetical protein D6780_06100 [Candidatus Dadabacteria bacterium]|nr:MAG: hypothetical protein D6780_06100 [Candidatus Dadabacteria bacterium]
MFSLFKNKTQDNSADKKAHPFQGLNLSLPKGITITKDKVNFLGVELERREAGPCTPRMERFKDNVLTIYDLKLMQKIAIAWELNQPVLIESGSGLGKTETVERMCAMLGWECYYANCHDFEPDMLIGSKTVREDTKSGFGWKDGIVVQAIRNGGVLYLDEYNFMRGDVRGRLHEILDAILRGKDEIVLIENDGERVKVHPNFRVVCSQNPPGGSFSDREVLDPAQITRFVYLKEPTEMPKWLKRARALGLQKQEIADRVIKENWLSSKAGIKKEELINHPQLKPLLERFIDFDETIDRMVQNGELANDQPQPLFFAFQRDLNRILKFIEQYYNGNLYETFKKALRYYYLNRFESKSDRRIVEELINAISPPKEEPNRRNSFYSAPGDNREGGEAARTAA